LYYHDGSGTYTNANLEAGDNSYRYAGTNPNNYVCFGSDAESCPTENLYRIIGVFGDQVKLIKHDFATTAMLGTGASTVNKSSYGNYKGALTTIPVYYWSGSSSNKNNTWSSSTLNTTALNTTYINYLNGIDEKWANMIATTEWKVGGMSWANGGTASNIAKTAYNYEVGTNAATTTYSSKIGLMYVSDYYYGASPTYWSYSGYNSSDATLDYRAAIGENWMYSGIYEWTMSRRSDNSNGAFSVSSSGYVYSGTVYGSNYGVRPSFRLSSSVNYAGGEGSAESPITITY